MNHVVEATEIFSVNYIRNDCRFFDSAGPDDPGPECWAADD